MEIKLDKENGGTVKQHGIGIGKILPIIGLAIAGILMIVLLIFAVIKMRDTDRQKRNKGKKEKHIMIDHIRSLSFRVLSLQKSEQTPIFSFMASTSISHETGDFKRH